MLTLDQTKALLNGYRDMVLAGKEVGYEVAEDRLAEFIHYAMGGPVPSNPRECVIELLEILGSAHDVICEGGECFSETILDVILSLGDRLEYRIATKARKRA